MISRFFAESVGLKFMEINENTFNQAKEKAKKIKTDLL